MSLDAKTREKLTRLLMLSTSPVDGEALTAIRKAGSILAARGLSWESVMGEPVIHYVTEPAPRPRKPRKPEGAVVGDEAMAILNDLIDRPLSEAGRQFVDDIMRYLGDHGYITAKQAEALQRMQARYAA